MIKDDAAAPRWTKPQRAQIEALQQNRWWPFDKADPKVLAYLNKQPKSKPGSVEHEEALL